MALDAGGLSHLWDRIRKYVNDYVTEYDRLTVASTFTKGQVRPDGTTITVDADGTIHGRPDLSPATVSDIGGVKPDGVTILIDANGTIRAAVSMTYVVNMLQQMRQTFEVRMSAYEDQVQSVQSLEARMSACEDQVQSLEEQIRALEGALSNRQTVTYDDGLVVFEIGGDVGQDGVLIAEGTVGSDGTLEL